MCTNAVHTNKSDYDKEVVTSFTISWMEINLAGNWYRTTRSGSMLMLNYTVIILTYVQVQWSTIKDPPRGWHNWNRDAFRSQMFISRIINTFWTLSGQALYKGQNGWPNVSKVQLYLTCSCSIHYKYNHVC